MAQLNLDGLSRDEQFTRAAEFAGVPEAVARAQWAVESTNGKNMNSSAGARGHFQTMPATQATFEQRIGKKLNPYVFQDSLELWAHTMQENMRLAKGNLSGAIAIYHGGPNPKMQGPRTAEYVQKVTGLAYGGEGTAVNMPAQGFSWKGGDIDAAWRGDAIPDIDSLRAEALRVRSAKEVEGTVLRGMRDEGAAAVAATGNDGSMIDARRAISHTGVLESVARPQTSTNVADTTEARATDTVQEQQLMEDAARREGWSNWDKVGSTWDTGPLGATYRALTRDIDYNTPQGWVYDPKEWELPDYSASELEQIRDASWNPSALANAKEDIRHRRYTNQIVSDMSPWEQLSAGLIGGFTDPVGAAAAVATGGLFSAAGVGATTYAAAGRPVAALVSSGVEGAVGNVAVDFGLDILGENRTAGDYFTDAAFGVGFGLIAPYRGIMRQADEARLDALSQGLYAQGAQVRERVLADVEAAGGNVSTKEIDNLIRQANQKEQKRWAEANMQNVVEEDRLFPRPDAGYNVDAAAWQSLSDSIDAPAKAPYAGPEITTTDLGDGYFSTAVPDGRGEILYADTNGEVFISTSALDPSLRGQGVGKQMYKTIIDKALAEGKVVRSDIEVSEEASRVYDSLAREGYTVERSPRANFDEDNRITYGGGDSVYRVTAAPPVASLTPAPDAPSLVPRALIATKSVRDRIFGTYGLKAKVSDNALRLQMGEYLARAEQITQKYDINEDKLATMLERVGLESDAGVLLKSKNPAVQAIGLMMTEHGEGAGGRMNFNAAVDLKARYQGYTGTTPREYRIAYKTWRSSQGVSPLKDNFTGSNRASFDRQLNWYRENLLMGNELDVHPAIKAASDALDRSYNRMAADQILAKVVGWASLPAEWVRGYGQRQWNGEAIKTTTNVRRESMVAALREQLAERMEFTGDEFLDKLSRLYFERISERTLGMYRSPGRITNFNNADILRDSLKSMGLSEEEILKNLNRFTRGGAGHTRGRFDLDVTKTYGDAEGNFTLHDYLSHDVMGKFSRYSNRVSGEVSAARFGVMGDAGIDVMLKTLDATGASRKEFEAAGRVLDRYVGRSSGPANPDILQTISNASSAAMMGGGIWNQMGEYINAIPTVGIGGVADALKLGPKMAGDVMKLLRGETVNDDILTGLESVGGVRIGMGEFDMYAGPQYTQENMLYGPEGAGLLTTVSGKAAHAQQVWSGQVLARAVQTRGLTKIMVEKVLTALHSGKRNEMGRALRDIGLDDELLDVLQTTLPETSVFDSQGILRSFDPTRLATAEHDAQFANFFNALNRGANQMIQGEFVGETGAWASKPLLRFMLKFRTFSVIAHQKQLGRYAGLYGAGGAAAIMIAGMGMAIPLYAARTMLTASLMPEDRREEWLSDKFNPLAIGRATMNYVSAMGMLPDVADLLSGAAGGWYEAATDERLPQWAKPTGGRTLAREDAIGGILGPGVGWANDVVQAAGGNLDAGLSVLPFGRMPVVIAPMQALRDHIREGKDDNDIY